MKVNLNLLYGMLQDNPPAFAILIKWMLDKKITALNIVDEVDLPSNLHVIYTRLQDQFKDSVPKIFGQAKQPTIIESATTEEVEEPELISGGCIIFNIQGEHIPIPEG